MKNSKKEKTLKSAVLVYFASGDSVWMATKARNIGEGKLCGYGGGIERGETEIRACLRETKKETGGVTIHPDLLLKVAILHCKNELSDGTNFTCVVHVYIAKNWGEKIPKETEEMLNPKLFKISALPFKKMMPADEHWLPYVLHGKRLRVWAHYSPFQKKLIGKVRIKEQTRFNKKAS